MAPVDPDSPKPTVPAVTWLLHCAPFAILVAAWLLYKFIHGARAAGSVAVDSGRGISPAMDVELQKEERAFAARMLGMAVILFPTNLGDKSPFVSQLIRASIPVSLALVILATWTEDATLDRAGHLWVYAFAASVAFIPFMSMYTIIYLCFQMCWEGKRLEEGMDLPFQLLDLLVIPLLVVGTVFIADPGAILNSRYTFWPPITFYAFQPSIWGGFRSEATRMLADRAKLSATYPHPE